MSNVLSIIVNEGEGKYCVRKVGLAQMWYCGGADCSYLVQDSDRWRTFVNTVMNCRFHNTQGVS
jgi:hypothetical protein